MNTITIPKFTILTVTVFLSLVFTSTTNAQEVQSWQTSWITHPEISGQEQGVYLFRRDFELDAKPAEFIIHLSADNRYKLYINGTYVTEGPARGDLLKWRYETLDIASYLKKGNNVIAAKVWNMAELRPEAQFTHATGFILQGHSEAEAFLNTDENWQVLQDSSYQFFKINLNEYYVTGPGEFFTAAESPKGWMSENTGVKGWLPAKKTSIGGNFRDLKRGWLPQPSLFPREIPLMERKEQSFASVRRIEGLNNVDAILAKDKEVTIPVNRKVTILLDQLVLTNAYPRLHFSGGNGSTVKITYAESLFETQEKNGEIIITKNKGNRDEIKGKVIKGNHDLVKADGREHIYEPLWWRTFRYVQLDITTGNEPLVIHEFNSTFTGYPLAEKGQFKSNETGLQDIWEVSWRTQRLCAGETFFDCPYYEQLQYVGDTRIQTLIAFYASGDTLLWRRAINDFYDSRLPIGITQSRYPSHSTQLIPTYSLVWITMLHDYYMHCGDVEYIQDMLPAAMEILDWFENRLSPSGLSGHIEGWNYVDWVQHPGWNGGRPPGEDQGESAIISLQYIYTLQKAVELFEYFDLPDMADRYGKLAHRVQEAVYNSCFVEKQGVLADTPEKKYFSQHANVLAVLTQTIPSGKEKEIMQKILDNDSIAQCSYYFRFYLTEALKLAGLSHLYIQQLEPWHEMLQNGLTTFIESPEPTRSDCHAWSASPVYHFLSLVSGIEPAAPGFNKVRIAPNPGSLQWIEGSMPWQESEIKVSLKLTKEGKVKGEVFLPAGLQGNFVWSDHEIPLKQGVNSINL